MNAADKPVAGVSPAEQQVADAVARRMLGQMEFDLQPGSLYAGLEETYGEYTAVMDREPTWGLVSEATLSRVRTSFQPQQLFTSQVPGMGHAIRFNNALLRTAESVPDDKLIWQIQAP